METLTNWLLDNIALLIPYIAGSTSIVAYFLERRKRHIDLKQQDATALQTMQEAYDKFTADSLKNYNDLKLDQDELKKKIKVLENDIEKTIQALKDKSSQYSDLEKDYKELSRKYEDCYKNNMIDEQKTDK